MTSIFRAVTVAAFAAGIVACADTATDGVFYAFDLATGTVRWTNETEGAAHDATFGFDRTSIQSTAAVDDAPVLFGSRDAGVNAVWLRGGDGTIGPTRLNEAFRVAGTGIGMELPAQ